MISVIIPVHNQEAFLAQCLNSVIAQGDAIFEVIIVDDGSTDSSRDITNSFVKKDKRIRLLTQDQKGAGAARNYGLSVAKGKYVHFLDSDDWLEPGAYKKLTNIANSNNSDVVIFCYNRFNQMTGEIRPVKLFTGTKYDAQVSIECSKRILLDTSVVPWNKIYKRDYLVNIKAAFDELPVANDRTFHYRVVINTKRITLHEELLINYRDNNPKSLVGEGRVNRFDSIIAANKNILSISCNLDTESRRIIYEANLKDFIYFYKKISGAKQKMIVSGMISGYLNDHPYPAETISQENDWSLRYKVWRHLRRGRNIKHIPVVLATNDNYAPYLYVTLKSISDNLCSDYLCDVYIFHTGLNEKYIKLYEGATEFANLRILTLNIKALTTNHMQYSRAHYSSEMYYRLLIPEVLDMYESVIYLDCDLVVNCSLHDLYEINIGDNYLLGVRNFCDDSMYKWITNKLNLSPESYVNSGVLVFNTEKFNIEALKEKCLNFLSKHDFLACPDQDMFNSVCAGKIGVIDSGWNYQWHHGFRKFKQSNTMREYSELVDNASRKMYIVHYTSGAKAWSHPLYENASHFWNYARRTKLYGDIVKDNCRKKIQSILKRLGEVNNK